MRRAYPGFSVRRCTCRFRSRMATLSPPLSAVGAGTPNDGRHIALAPGTDGPNCGRRMPSFRGAEGEHLTPPRSHAHGRWAAAAAMASRDSGRGNKTSLNRHERAAVVRPLGVRSGAEPRRGRPYTGPGCRPSPARGGSPELTARAAAETHGTRSDRVDEFPPPSSSSSSSRQA
jgi:hypothetical protein